MMWNWDASCSPDAVLYILYGMFILLRGWQPCPTLEDPGAICPIYDRTGWTRLTDTPALRLQYDLADPGVGSVAFLTVEAEDDSGNLSPPDDVIETDCGP